MLNWRGLAWIGVWMGLVLAVKAQDASTMFAKVEPSIVLIGTDEGFGSGVIVSEQGLIITNYHVVVSPLPLTVTAKAKTDTGYVERKYTDVQLVKVHKEYDLALLQVKTTDRFTPLPVVTTTPAKTGMVSYVIGNPGGANDVLRNTITSGLISSDDREIDKLHYLQISAAINPGNSGGAAVDAAGNLLGIVTFKSTDTEGIGFAIPIRNFVKTDFVPVTERKNNVEAASAYKEKGIKAFNLARETKDPHLKQVLLEISFYFLHMSLVEAPTANGSAYNVGLTYYERGDKQMAEAYFRGELVHFPYDGNALYMHGVCLNEKGKVDEALACWIKGALHYHDVCAENAAVVCVQKGRYSEGLYLMSLSMLANPGGNRGKRQRVHDICQANAPESVRRLVAGKRKPADFSEKEFATLGAKAPPATATATDKAGGDTFDAEQRKAVAGAIAIANKAGNAMSDEWITKRLPMPIRAVVPALGGTRLVVSMSDLKKVAVLNLQDGVSLDYIGVFTSDAMIAAGGTRLVLYYPGQRILEVYDLVQRRKIKASHLQADVTLRVLTMGLANARYAFICYGAPAGSTANLTYALLDLDTAQIVPISSAVETYSYDHPNRFWNSDARTNVHVCVDDQLAHLTCWQTEFSPNGYEYVALDTSQRKFTDTYKHETCGALMISSDGGYVYTSEGRLYAREARQITRYGGSCLYPVSGGNLFVQVTAKKYIVRDNISQTELYAGDLPATGSSSSAVPVEQRVFASSMCNRIAVVDTETNSIHSRLLLPQSAAPTGSVGNSLVVSPGAKWTYTLGLPKGSEARLEDAPKGCTLTGDKLSWSVPADAAAGVVEILVDVKMGDNEDYKVIKLRIE